MGNKRVFYACQGLALNDQALAGVQSLSVNTQNTTHAVESFGSLNIPATYSELPNSTISISRVLSGGNSFIYPIDTDISAAINKHDYKICLFIGSDTESFVGNGNPQSIYFKDLSISSISYNFDIDNFFTEDVVFIGYYKEFSPESGCDVSLMESLPSGASTYRRQHLKVDNCNFGKYIPSGNNVITNISIDIPFNVNFIQEFAKPLNRSDKKYRFSSLPITANIGITTTYQNAIDFDQYDFSSSYDNSCECSGEQCSSQSETLTFHLCDDSVFTFNNCILDNIDYNGGGADGANVSLTYNYICYNSFKIHNGSE